MLPTIIIEVLSFESADTKRNVRVRFRDLFFCLTDWLQKSVCFLFLL